MTTITSDDVQYLAQLSNIELSNEEGANLQQDLTNIVGYIDQLGELDTEGVEPTYQVTGLQNVWRDDEVVLHPAGRDGLLKLAPETLDNQVKIPKVL